MDPLTNSGLRVVLADPVLWAGISVPLAIFLLTMSFRRLILPLIAAVRGSSTQATRGVAPWAPSLEAGDRRHLYRRGGNPVAVQLVGLEGNRAFHGVVLDRSRGGLLVEAPLPAPTGITLLVRPSKAPSESLWVPVTVRWCRAGRSRNRIGCQFVEEPALDILALFG